MNLVTSCIYAFRWCESAERPILLPSSENSEHVIGTGYFWVALYIKRRSEVQQDSIALRETDGVITLSHGRVLVWVSRAGQDPREICPNLALTWHCAGSIVVMEKVTLPTGAVISPNVVVAEMITQRRPVHLQVTLVDVFGGKEGLKASEPVLIGEVAPEDH